MVEDITVQKAILSTGKVDTIISEPIGVMLLHERMVSLQSSSTGTKLNSRWKASCWPEIGSSSRAVSCYLRPGTSTFAHSQMRPSITRRRQR